MSPPCRNGRRQTMGLLRGRAAPLEMGWASFCLARVVAGRGCGALCATLPPQVCLQEPILGEREPCGDGRGAQPEPGGAAHAGAAELHVKRKSSRRASERAVCARLFIASAVCRCACLNKQPGLALETQQAAAHAPRP